MPLLGPYLLSDYGFSQIFDRRYHEAHQLELAAKEKALSVATSPVGSGEYYTPRRQEATAKDFSSSVVSNKDKFQVNLDVLHFKPEEISVKTIDGYIVIEGKHEEKEDGHGYVSRQFMRRYLLPEDAPRESVESRLSDDGVLTVIALKKLPDSIRGEREVPITRTGSVRHLPQDQSSSTEEMKDPKESKKEGKKDGKKEVSQLRMLLK